jgi:hypothetical protein
MTIYNQDASILGDLTVNPSNGAGNILTMSVTNIVTFRTSSEILSDIGGALDADVVHKAGAETITGLKTFTNGLISDTIQLSGGIGTQGTFSWNVDEETVDLIQNGTTLQIGQEIQYNVKNKSGVTISNGDSVMATGTLGNSGRITVAKMVNDGSVHPKYFLGIATEDILNDTDGKVTKFGKVRGIQTDGVNYGEVWIDGDLIYNNPTTPGGLTNVQPEAPSYKSPMAIVINAKATNGAIMVRADGNEGIHDLYDVFISSKTDNDLIFYNLVNDRWENKQLVIADVSDFTDNSTNWNTAFGWGNHALEGYLESLTTANSTFVDVSDSGTATEPVITASLSATGTPDSTKYLRGDNTWASLPPAGAEINDLTSSVTWANVPDVNITESSVTQHESALTITESQISDLSHFVPSTLLSDYGFTDNSANWNTAFGWGDHASLYVGLTGDDSITGTKEFNGNAVFNSTVVLPTPFYSEDFSVSLGDFTTSGDAVFTRVTDDGNGDLFSARSGAIGNNEISILTLSKVTTQQFTLCSFDYKTSTEENFDWLFVVLDGQLIDRFSGTNGWTTRQFYIEGVGTHEIKFIYFRDHSDGGGTDQCWIDNVALYNYNIDVNVAGSVNIEDELYITGNSIFKGKATYNNELILNSEFHLFNDVTEVRAARIRSRSSANAFTLYNQLGESAGALYSNPTDNVLEMFSITSPETLKIQLGNFGEVASLELRDTTAKVRLGENLGSDLTKMLVVNGQSIFRDDVDITGILTSEKIVTTDTSNQILTTADALELVAAGGTFATAVGLRIDDALGTVTISNSDFVISDGTLSVDTITQASSDFDRFLVHNTTTKDIQYRTGTQLLQDTITLGADNQIPVMNGTTSFDYSSDFTFSGGVLNMTPTSINLYRSESGSDYRGIYINSGGVNIQDIDGWNVFAFTGDTSNGLSIKLGDSQGNGSGFYVDVDQINDRFIVAGGYLQLNNITEGTADYDKFLVSDSGQVKYRTGTQLLQDIGASSQTLSLGADNQIPYMNGTTDFSYTSVFTFNGTTLQIGTAVGGYTQTVNAQIKGKGGFGGEFSISKIQAVSGEHKLAFGSATSGSWTCTLPEATGTIGLANGADNQIPFMNGTTAFEYSSTLTFNGSATLPNLTISGSTAGRLTLLGANQFQLQSSGTQFSIEDENIGEHFFNYNNVGQVTKIGDLGGAGNITVLTIDDGNETITLGDTSNTTVNTTGKVGIGESSPDGQLQVKGNKSTGTDSVGILILNDVETNSRMVLDSNDIDAYDSSGVGSNLYLNDYSGGNIICGGKLNVGNANTTYNLDVTGTGRFTGDVIVPAETYGSGWNGSNEVPTKNDVYDKIENLQGTSLPTSAGANGEIVFWGSSGTFAAGEVVYYSTAGVWTRADADSSTTRQLIGVALGTSAATNGILLRGAIYNTAYSGLSFGLPLYLSNTAGDFTTTAPTGAGDYVRVLGYKVATNVVYFRPDNTWIVNPIA